MKVVALTPVKHDGKRYEAGDALQLPNKAAAALIASGAVEEADKAEAEALKQQAGA